MNESIGKGRRKGKLTRVWEKGEGREINESIGKREKKENKTKGENIN